MYYGAQPQRASIQPATIPAPIRGINALSSLAEMEINDAIYTKNIDPSSRGLKVRPGYSEWANSFSGDQVKTVIPYKGTAEDGSEDLLLACTSVGIYDITSSTESPSAVLTWGTSSTDAGWCSYEVFTNDAGARVLLVCDLENGYNIYTESTQTWSVPSISGVTAGNLVFVTIWKNRVWFVEKDSNSAWYSGIGVYAGTMTKFNFGNKFLHGGYLKSLYGWSLDSGIGPDDYLVALSSAGDVLVYGGTDPSSSSTFGQVGTWYIGELPGGRRNGLSVGGDLYLLSSYGIISSKDLLSGKNPYTYEGSVSYRINPVLRTLLADNLSSMGWEMQILPEIGKLILTTPKVTNQPYTQYVYDVNLQSWGVWTGIPMTTIVSYGGNVFCAAALQVHKVTGTLDQVTISDNDPQPIYWSFLTSYNELETPQINKIVEFIRPRFVGGGAPAFDVRAFYDYDLSELSQASANTEGSDVWDTAVWDLAIWGGGLDKFQELRGASGMGKTVAVAMSGATTLETTLVDIGVMWRKADGSRGVL